MLSSRYIFKSNEVKYRYINGSIDQQAYLNLLEAIKKEELASVVFDFNFRLIEEEISAFESQQIDEANQKITNRKNDVEALKLKNAVEKIKQLEEKIKNTEKGKDKEMQKQTLEERIFQERTDFYEKQAPEIMEKYKKDSRKFRSRHDRLQFIIILGSALSTSTTGATIFTGNNSLSISLKIIAAFFSLAVTIASGSIAYFKYKERSNDIQKTVDAIEDDYTALKLGIGTYDGLDIKPSLSKFAGNTHTAISEHKKKQQLLDQPPDAKSNQTA